MRHRGIVTGTLVAVLLVNLLVVVRLSPPDVSRGGDLPIAARCQGGGPGCAEQPLIPPPVGGLPHFDAPPPPVMGQLVAVAAIAPTAVHEAPPDAIEHPPAPELIA
jgi:hypothetical protein